MAVTLEFSAVPYPGLRPFRYEESDIFFGREAQIDQLLARLSRNHFLAVTGPSGCGKSSLIKAGMVPALSAGFMTEAGSRWRICELRPGDRPLGRLARVLASADILGTNRTDLDSVALVEATLRRGPLGLIEVAKGAETLKGANLLVVVDQFEEIFRYRDRMEADEADAFVALLLASAGQREVPIYVVITMRSDYLGDCALFYGLPEAVSDAQYLTPRLTREDLELAIAGPARVFGGRVEPRLLNRLINDFGSDPDQLPLLQHALARLWNRVSVTPRVLTVDDYEAIGGLSNALSNHCDQVLAELTPERQRIAEVMFRRLSGTQDDRQDVRAPARISEVARIAAVDAGGVIAVAEAFRRDDRCFLTAPEGPLDENTLLDLSHESLIRQWNRLAGWAADEANSAEMYRRLRDWALRWDQGDAGLWRGPDLANAVAWRQDEAPNEAWAERYGGRDQFHLAMKFLAASEEAAHAAAEEEEARRQRQLRRVRGVAWGFAGATAVLVAGIALYSFAYIRPHVAYYKDHITVWGVPKGIEPIGEAEIGHRGRSYRITTRGLFGPVLSMELVNSAGHLGYGLFATTSSSEEKANTPFRWEFAYDAQGRLAYEIDLSRQGQRIETTVYGPPEGASTISRTAYEIGPNGSLFPEKGSCAAFERYDYSPEGYTTQIHYYDQSGNSTPGKDGAFASAIKSDPIGRRIEFISLSKDGKPINDLDGNAAERRFYDASGDLVTVENVDAAGRPSVANKRDETNIDFRQVNRYNEYGDVVEIYFQDENDNFLLLGKTCKILKFKLDEHGNRSEAYCVRQDGQSSETSWAITKNKFDSDDKIIESKYFDLHGRPVLGPGGMSQEMLKYDQDGNIAELSEYGADDRPTINDLGFHKKISEFKSAHEIRTEYRGTDERLIALDKGYAAVNKEYDAQGNVTVETYLGVDNGPAPDRTEGYAIKTVAYDACGRPTETRFFDADNHAIRSKKGYAGLRQSYDESNNVKEEAYFDERNRPGRSVEGYSRVTREYDRNRNVTDERFFDGQAKPFLVKGIYAEHKSRYDDHNDLVEETYLGSRAEPVANEKGWAKHTKDYDQHNALTGEAWFGPDSEPVLNDEGWARMTNVNDAHGRPLRTEWFGTDGKPAIVKQGYASRTRIYDDNGNVVEEAYFGTEGEPILSDDGYARIEKTYDALGHLTGWAHFGVHGEKVVATKEDYQRAKVVQDESNNRLEFAAFGPDDKPMKRGAGYFRNVMRYDAHNHLIEDAYFGVDNEAVVSNAGYSRGTEAFDSRGKLVEVAYFGIDGKPMIGPTGVAKFTHRYNDYGDLTEEAYFGTSGEPIARKEGYARLTRAYDKAGHILGESYFGIDGKPVNQENGYAKVTHRYNPAGGVLEDAYFGPGGDPVLNEQRYSRKVSIKDDNGFEIETAYFGTDGQPILNDRGFARAKVLNDELGRPIEWSYFGINGEQVIGKYAYHRAVQKLDARGNQLELQTFGVDGKPVEGLDPTSGRHCAKLVRRFDLSNREVGSQCFDASGALVAKAT